MTELGETINFLHAELRSKDAEAEKWQRHSAMVERRAHEELDARDAEIERLNAENVELRREIGGFPHLSDMRQCMVDAADENERLKARNEFLEKALDQAVERANLRVATPEDNGYCELNQALPVWAHRHPGLLGHLKEKENAN